MVELVMNFFKGTYEVAKACLLLPKHPLFVGYDMDEVLIYFPWKLLFNCPLASYLTPNNI